MLREHEPHYNTPGRPELSARPLPYDRSPDQSRDPPASCDPIGSADPLHAYQQVAGVCGIAGHPHGEKPYSLITTGAP